MIAHIWWAVVVILVVMRLEAIVGASEAGSGAVAVLMCSLRHTRCANWMLNVVRLGMLASRSHHRASSVTPSPVQSSPVQQASENNVACPCRCSMSMSM